MRQWKRLILLLFPAIISLVVQITLSIKKIKNKIPLFIASPVVDMLFKEASNQVELSGKIQFLTKIGLLEFA